MKILVIGPESSGTRMLVGLLRQAGASEVVHSSPMYRREQDEDPHTGDEFDAVVLVVRHGPCQLRSMVDNGHVDSESRARYETAWDIEDSTAFIQWHKLHIATYEALVHEPGALRLLCRDLGLNEEFDHDQIGDGNAKWYGGEWFRDDRPAHVRGVRSVEEPEPAGGHGDEDSGDQPED